MSQWSDADALSYMWIKLRQLPVSINDPVAQFLPPALDAARYAYMAIEIGAPADAIAAAKHEVAIAIAGLVLAASTIPMGYAELDDILEGVKDAGTDLKNW